LSSLYTSGTMIGELDSAEVHTQSNYLVCIHEAGRQHGKIEISIVAMQLSTGDIVYDQFVDESSRSELQTRLLALQPTEILISDKLSKETQHFVQYYVNEKNLRSINVRLERIPEKKFNLDDAKVGLTEFYKTKSSPESSLN
jgi:DNA mismatch repair protein MSH3